MAIEDFFVTSVTVQTAGTIEDRYGQTVADWDTATEADAAGWLQDLSGFETLGGRDTITSTHALYLPTAVAISGLDRVLIDGATYEVDGPTRTARTKEGAHHLEVPLRIVENAPAAGPPVESLDFDADIPFDSPDYTFNGVAV